DTHGKNIVRSAKGSEGTSASSSSTSARSISEYVSMTFPSKLRSSGKATNPDSESSTTCSFVKIFPSPEMEKPVPFVSSVSTATTARLYDLISDWVDNLADVLINSIAGMETVFGMNANI